MHIAEGGPPSLLMSEADRKQIREQMNRLLGTHHFKNSRRYPALLRFIVEETLEGRGEYLKERLLGIRVFDRPADYDTASDPIVRVTIAEIRKRIAQYYHDEEHDAEIRIELLPGRYAPEFRARREGVADRVSAIEAAEPGFFSDQHKGPSTKSVEPAAFGATRERQRASRKWWYALVSAGPVALVLASLVAWRSMRPSALEQFWAPVLASPRVVLFCLPTDVGRKRDANGVVFQATEKSSLPASTRLGNAGVSPTPTFLDHESLGENVVYSDMLATLDIANVLAARHRDYRVKLTVLTTLDDLRHGPVILIGGLDNQWTMRALAPLRYHFAGSDEDRYWISDSKNPSNKDWSLDLKQKYVAVIRDYAIIARLHNEQTGEPQMIVAGIGMSGTAAAGELITDEHKVEELRQRVGADFTERDFEAVLSTDVVNGIAGSPKIMAVHVW